MNSCFIIMICSLAVIFSACRNPESVLQAPSPESGAGMYIVNEGGFSGGGSLSYYDARRDTLYNNVAGINEHWIFPNDMKIVGSKGYVAVEGLDRIDIISLASSQVSGSISLPPSTGPEFLAANDSLLCTANANGTVSVIRLLDDSVTWTSPPVVGFPGGINLAGSRIAVTDIGLYPEVGISVKILDAVNKRLIDSVITGGGPGPLTGINGKMFVLLTSSSKILQINPVTDAVEDSVGLSGYYSDLTTDGRILFALNSDSVASISIQPLTVEKSSFIKRTSGLYFYSLGADPASGDVYIANVMSSGGSGELEIYTSAGNQKRPPAVAGTFPGAFAWRP